MKNILKLSNTELKEFFLKEENYINFDIPFYFTFQKILDKVNTKIGDKELKTLRNESPRNYEKVNYSLITNKDGKFAWRPFQIINPAIYVSLVNVICQEENWNIIKSRFTDFQENEKIRCHSLPMISEEENKTNKDVQILNWWQEIEQKSIVLAIDYHYTLHTDITDCYGSIYTHSIPWAIHTKPFAKEKENRINDGLIGVAIDNHLQDMSYGQTNGIPQGSVLMDFIAEIVLGYVDSLLTQKLKDINITEYEILRYRDDYRIFTNNPFEAEQIAKKLSEVLSDLGMKLNTDKTIYSDSIVTSSIKEDKRYWIENKRITENRQKWLIQIHLLSEKFPNSGTLDTQMREYLKSLRKNTREIINPEVLISLVTEISFRNPRVIPTAISILTILINGITVESNKQDLIIKIQRKFKQVPNSSLLKIWLQRLYLKIDDTIEYEELICKKAVNNKETIWETDWLNGRLKDILNNTPIVEKNFIKKLNATVSKKEVKKVTEKRRHISE